MAHFLKYTNAVFANIEKMSEFGGEAIFDVFKKPSVETKKRKAVDDAGVSSDQPPRPTLTPIVSQQATSEPAIKRSKANGL